MSRDIRVGTMAFNFEDWRGTFYPLGTPSTDRLAVHSTRFPLVELDTTFYAMPSPQRVAKWKSAVPASYRFVVKAPKSITHERGIEHSLEDAREFARVIHGFGENLGSALFQFPPSFKIERRDALRTFLSKLPTDVRYAVELRDASWFRTGTIKMFAELNVAWVAAQYEAPPRPIVVTTDFVYIRLKRKHNGFPQYDREQIDPTTDLLHWQKEIHALPPTVKHVYVIVGNDFAGHAPTTAAKLAAMLDAPLGPDPMTSGTLFK